MTRLFYHHVGQDGADRDFPRSLGRTLTADELEPHLVQDMGTTPGQHLSRQLRTAFPKGFNCWGVPIGAIDAFRRLAPGDIIFLLGHLQLVPYRIRRTSSMEYSNTAAR